MFLWIQRFITELKIYRTQNHPNVISIFTLYLSEIRVNVILVSTSRSFKLHLLFRFTYENV
jgi:hypothetical protein